MDTDRLHDVLTRAADPVPRPDLARTALATAHRSRRRRQGLVAGLTCAVAVVVTVVGVRIASDPVVELPPTAPTTDAAPTVDPTPPSIDPSVVQEKWDPRGVPGLAPVDVGLPSSLDPPVAPATTEGMSAAVALVERGSTLWLVDAAGTWAMLETPEVPIDRFGRNATLTTDGSRAVYTGDDHLLVLTVGEAEWQRFDYPDGFTTEADWGAAEMAPDGPDGTWIADRRRPRSWYVDLESGRFTAYDAPLDVVSSGPGGPLVRIGVDRGQRYLSVGSLAEPMTVWDSDYLDALSGTASDASSLAAARGVGGWSGTRNDTDEQNGLIALRLDDLSTRAYLPVPDPHYWYTDAGALRVLTWLDRDTVLASVVPQDSGGVEGLRYLFTWDVETGELRLASSLPAAYSVSVALTPSG